MEAVGASRDRCNPGGDSNFDWAGIGDGHACLAHGSTHTLGKIGGGLDVGARQEGDELLAAEASEDVAGTGRPKHHAGNGTKDLVADEVSIGVVDALEVVQIEDGNAEGPRLFQATTEEDILCSLDGGAAAEQARQLIVAGKEGELAHQFAQLIVTCAQGFFDPAQLAMVSHVDDRTGIGAGAVMQRGGRNCCREGAVIGASGHHREVRHTPARCEQRPHQGKVVVRGKQHARAALQHFERREPEQRFAGAGVEHHMVLSISRHDAVRAGEQHQLQHFGVGEQFDEVWRVVHASSRIDQRSASGGNGGAVIGIGGRGGRVQAGSSPGYTSVMAVCVVPASFARAMRDVYGDAGGAWLEELPSLVEAACKRWSLEAAEPAWPLTYNYVAPVTQADGSAAILKVGFPSKEQRTEAAALRHFAGDGMAALLAEAPELGALLLERLDPGQSLEVLEDDVAATSAAAGVMRRLRRPAPAGEGFPTVSDWGRGFAKMRATFGDAPPFSPALASQAEELFAALLASSGEQLLLHGDLHHGNILSARRAPWQAIDPKGVIGEAAYETGALLRNPRALFLQRNAGQAIERRLAELADELAVDRERLRGWGIAQAVLSAWWSYEDHGRGWEMAMTCAELLARGTA